ncbi:MAG: DUF1116 domain-containing protein [Candidatus Rokubacteria bacterium]|nr:DUF1116 domain-containing protein [Candidatus Rokubacteria bacterium]
MTSSITTTPRVVNVGVETFADAIRATGGEVVHTDWRPPGAGEAETAWALAWLTGDADDPDSAGSRVDRANREAVQRVIDATPRVRGIRRADAVWPALGRTLMHAGPPIAWDRMCGPMQGAVVGAVLYEGWAKTPDEAQALAASGGIAFAPCHHFGAVGPMAGIISPSMPVWVVENAAGGTVAYATLNEGLGKVLRFGAYDAEVLDRLRWIERVLAPGLAQAIEESGVAIDLRGIVARALHMGDEVHNRNVAATSLLFRALAGPLTRSRLDRRTVAEILDFIDGNNHFFLNLSMAAAKAALVAAHGVEASSLVTTMARNGVEFGIRVSGLGDRWFTAPAEVPDGLYFTGYSAADAAPDLGDSAITETAGLGGFSMATAPAMVEFVGGSAETARAATTSMYEITLARHPAFTLPVLGFQGAPVGIDVRAVVDTGIRPLINTGIAHRRAGVGQIGAGIVRAPMACVEAALLALSSSR